MISEILSETLESKIVQTIQSRCHQFAKSEKINSMLYYEPYTTYRKKYSLTAAVLSGFSPSAFSVEGVKTEDLKYGLANNLCLPELHSDSAIIQIYSDGAKPLNNAIVRNRCKEFNLVGSAKPQFLIIQFSASKDGILSAIHAMYPDENCNVVDEKVLFAAPKKKILPVAG